MNHTPTQSGAVYRCDCGFHAIATTNGMHIIASGAGRDIHLAAIARSQQEQRAWVERTRVRLIHQYRDHKTKPSEWMAECRRLLDHITAEYEG